MFLCCLATVWCPCLVQELLVLMLPSGWHEEIRIVTVKTHLSNLMSCDTWWIWPEPQRRRYSAQHNLQSDFHTVTWTQSWWILWLKNLLFLFSECLILIGFLLQIQTLSEHFWPPTDLSVNLRSCWTCSWRGELSCCMSQELIRMFQLHKLLHLHVAGSGPTSAVRSWVLNCVYEPMIKSQRI